MRPIKYKQQKRNSEFEVYECDKDYAQNGYLIQFVNNENSVFGLVEKPDGTLELIEYYRIKFSFPFASTPEENGKAINAICKKYGVKEDRFYYAP